VLLLRIQLHNLGILGIFLFTFGGATILTVLSELLAFNLLLSDLQRNLDFVIGVTLFAIGLFLMSAFRKPYSENGLRSLWELIFGFGSLIFGSLFFSDFADELANYVYASHNGVLGSRALIMWNYSLLAFFFVGMGVWLIIKGKKYL